jgi:hypothetical protein
LGWGKESFSGLGVTDKSKWKFNLWFLLRRNESVEKRLFCLKNNDIELLNTVDIGLLARGPRVEKFGIGGRLEIVHSLSSGFTREVLP